MVGISVPVQPPCPEESIMAGKLWQDVTAFAMTACQVLPQLTYFQGKAISADFFELSLKILLNNPVFFSQSVSQYLEFP